MLGNHFFVRIIQTHERLYQIKYKIKKLFIRTKHNMRIFEVIPSGNKTTTLNTELTDGEKGDVELRHSSAFGQSSYVVSKHGA